MPFRALVEGRYERLPAVESIDRTLTLTSEVLDLELRAKGEEMRFHDPATGETLLSYGEEHAARREEAAARRAAEARVTELEARVRALGGTPGKSNGGRQSRGIGRMT